MCPIQRPPAGWPTRPTYVYGAGRLHRLRPSGPGDPPTLVSRLTFNGTLFLGAAIRRAGLLDDRLFFGQEDVEFSRRLGRLGQLILRVPWAAVAHDGYRWRRHLDVLGFTFLLPGGEPVVRSYYSVRNALYVERLYGHPHAVVLKAALRLPVSLAYILLLGDRRWRRIKARLFGIRDAMLGSLGAKRYAFLTDSRNSPR